MKKGNSGFLVFLAVWMLVSFAIFILGLGFAGSIKALFEIPYDLDSVSFGAWAISWILVISPFIISIIYWLKRRI
jgi:uncharacterized membrane protein (DUF485 family)